MDGDWDRDPHWSTGLSSQGPVEEQKEEEYEQGSQDVEVLVQPLRQCDWSNESSPKPVSLGLKKHGIKLWVLKVADNWKILKRATDFLELILYPATLLKVFISCRSSLVEFFGSLMYTIISSANNESLTSSFPIRIFLIPLCCLMLLLELQALYWRGMEREDSLVVFLILVERLWVFLHSIWC